MVLYIKILVIKTSSHTSKQDHIAPLFYAPGQPAGGDAMVGGGTGGGARSGGIDIQY